MRLLTKPYRWGCLITSFAMALHTTVQRLEDLIGHDGSAFIDLSLTEPSGRRGFHIQELIDASLTLGFSVTPFELYPRLAHPSWGEAVTVIRKGGNWKRFEELIKTSTGVITGRGRTNNHAVAVWLNLILDPDGSSYVYSKDQCEARGFYPQCLWIVSRQ